MEWNLGRDDEPAESKASSGATKAFSPGIGSHLLDERVVEEEEWPSLGLPSNVGRNLLFFLMDGRGARGLGLEDVVELA